MNDKAQAMIDELVSAAIAFGRGQLPDWQTRIEDARVALREYITEIQSRIIDAMAERTVLLIESGNTIGRMESRIAELEAAQRWIPVGERLPKENAPVLVLTVLGGMFVDFIHGKSVVTGNPDFYELDVEDVTHWMPLPKLPEVQE